MCGFAGILDSSRNHAELEHTAAAMTATLALRGPDAGAVLVASPVALGHRRLSILDLTPTGAQPMVLPLNGTSIAYNGEVYNFAELRTELEGRGHRFIGRSDTEVILHAYAEWGMEGFARLEGIFGFALWDAPKRRLMLVRDRLGIKPVFFAQAGDRIVFGSEIKAVLAAGAADTGIDDQALAEYLWYGNAHDDRTIYRGVRALLPGHYLIAEAGAVRIEPWWKLEQWTARPSTAESPEDAADQVRAALDKAVARQLVADVPVGIFLSGGVDSSAIAASAMAQRSSPIASYSVGFDFDRGVNELPKARRIADHLGLDHHEMRVGASDLADVLVALVRAHDEPFADAANIPLYMLARALNGAVKVVLQGDGGDELFGGYRRYAMLRNLAFWKLWPRFATPLLHRAGASGARMARMFDAIGARDDAERMALLLTVETLRQSPLQLLLPEARDRLAASTDPFLAYRRSAERFRDADPVQKMLLTDLCVQLPSQFLPKVDRATMAQGVEARVPLLDDRMVELAVSLPSRWKVRGTQKKIVLRDAFRARLPAQILDGPKTGFGVPFEYWLRAPLYSMARDAILDPAFVGRFGFDRTALEHTLEQHRSGTQDRGFTLWKIFQLALWSRERT